MNTLNLTAEMEELIRDIINNTPEFCHIDHERVLVCVANGRSGRGGTYAKIHPLRFAGGERTMTARRGRRSYLCTMPSINHLGKEMLYVIYFLVPRFLALPFKEKLVTVFHELYHISPDFDGDIRRFPGKNYAHGASTKSYNALMRTMVERYLEVRADHSALCFLEGDLAQLRSRYGAIVARKLQAPRISVVPA